MTHSTAELGRRASEEIWGKGNTAAIDQLYAYDYVNLSPAPGLPNDREGIKMEVEMYRSAFPDMAVEIHDIVADESKCVVRYTASGTHEGDLMGMPPTGRSVKIDGVSIAHIENGKIVREYALNDTMSLMEQLGALPEAA